MSRPTDEALELAASKLDAAADLIDKFGLAYGQMGNKVVGFCAIGALMAVSSTLLAKRRLWIYLLGAGLDSPVAWSDTHTQPEVSKGLRQAARQTRALIRRRNQYGTSQSP